MGNGLPQLPEVPELAPAVRRRLETEFERFRDGLPGDLRAHCREAYGLDLEGEYAGYPVRVPFGKASGQLSLNTRQVSRDRAAGLGFAVLKTVIAEDGAGARSMGAWATPDTRMRVKAITAGDGTAGWTVTWKGRGWPGSLEQYLRFFGEALEVAPEVVVAPSVKYHLPAPGESEFRVEEYTFTTRALREIWEARRSGPMPLEKDFSPTLAGDDRSREREQILLWLQQVPGLVQQGSGEFPVRLGVKLMNALFGPEFQLRMLQTVCAEADPPPEFVVYANRLFDPDREFEGVRGVAYGGPELSRRNLEVLERFRLGDPEAGGKPRPAISATGDILTGKRALEYGLRGASSCQLHTAFQLPDRYYAARMRNKSEAVLHHLLFQPDSGLLAWLLHLSNRSGSAVHWRDLPRLANEWPA